MASDYVMTPTLWTIVCRSCQMSKRVSYRSRSAAGCLGQGMEGAHRGLLLG